MHDFTEHLDKLFTQYISQRNPLEIDFKSVVPIRNYDRLTHSFHPYPAKLIQNIPIYFINNSITASKKCHIYDPFCGSGTVALESLASNNFCFTTDINPLACLLTSVKCTYLEDTLILQWLFEILNKSQTKNPMNHNIPNQEIWFEKRTYNGLSKLCQAIQEIDNIQIRDFFNLNHMNSNKH